MERDTKPPRKEHHQKDTKPALTTKAQPLSQTPNNVVSEKVAAAKPEKVDQIDHSLASKDLKLQKGTGLFQKAPKSNDSKPKLVLCRPQIPQKPHETRQLSIASRAKRSTGAFEIYEYPALKIAPETIERHEHTSLHHRITKKESNQGPGGSFDIRSRIIKKPHKF